MSRRGRVIVASGLAIILVLTLSMGAFAASGTKKLSAIFRNIKLNVNGKVLQASEEPFIIDGRTYVPLRVVGEALGAWVDWNANTSVITISGTSATKALEEQLQQKDIQIAQLQLQIEELKKNQSTTPDKDKSDKSLSDLRSELRKDYDELGKVDINDIKLTGDSDKVTVNIDVDLDDYDDEWEDLTDSKIKSWVADICEDIQDYYDDDTSITGKIKDIDSKDTLVTFTKNGTKSLSVSYKDEDYRGGNSGKIRDLENDLLDDYKKLGSVKIGDISVSGDKDDVEVEIEVDLGDYDDQWADLSNSKIKGWLQDICDDIQKFYSKNTQITGSIIDTDNSDYTLVKFEKNGTSSLKVTYKDSAYR